MPLNVRRFGTSCLVILVLGLGVMAQAITASNDEMKQRLARARAFVAVRSYTAAAFELDKIRKESADAAIQNIATVLLTNVYLEQGDHKKAQELLIDTFNKAKAVNSTAAYNAYLTCAGQVAKTARGQVERYRLLGMNVSDPSLPNEVNAEIDKMRATLELIVDHAKELGEARKRTSESMALLEETTNVRGAIARDAYDSTRWKNEVADARERLSAAQSTVVEVDENNSKSFSSELIVSAAAAPSQPPQQVRTNEPPRTAGNAAPPTSANTPASGQTTPANSSPVFTNVAINRSDLSGVKDLPKPVMGDLSPAPQPPTQIVAKNEPKVEAPKTEPKKDQPKPVEPPAQIVAQEETAKELPKTADPGVGDSGEKTSGAGAKTPETKGETNGETNVAATPELPANVLVSVGSLMDFATRKVQPTYPSMARTMRQVGLVTVNVVIDEQGEVAEVRNANGPELLKRAALDVVKKWKFRPFSRDGQPVKASGYLSFNFTL